MNESAFTTLAERLDSDGAEAAIDQLIETFENGRQLPQLFEALLIKKRHELGLPLEGTESIRDIPEEHQQNVEDYYVEVCQRVGGLFLEQGDIVSAWPYYRAIDEHGPIAKALDEWTPPQDEEDDDEEFDPDAGFDSYELLDAVVDIAFNQGAHPVRGYDLILSNYGTCRAITTIEHQFPFPGKVKEDCAAMLIRQLYGELQDGLRADIERDDSLGARPGEEEGAPSDVPEEADVVTLIEGRDWLFENMGYHVDISHLQSCVRVAAGLSDPEIIGLAIQMCEYGRRLARDFQVHERPPFDDFYNDYRIFLRAITGEGVDGAVRYFTSKLERQKKKTEKAAESDLPPGFEEDHTPFCAEVLVYLLDRVDRHDAAIDTHLEYLLDTQLTISPPLLQLCDHAGDYTKLLERAQAKDDLLQYGLGLLKRATS